MDSPTSGDNQGRLVARWTPEEDVLLTRLVQLHGGRDWARVSESIEGRTSKSCRLRWCNQLSPKIDRGPFTPEEDEIIIRAHAYMGTKWAHMARLMNGRRTDNAIKNRWNSTLRRVRRRNHVSSTNVQVVSRGGSSEADCYKPVIEDEPFPNPDQVSIGQLYGQELPFYPIQGGFDQFCKPETGLSLSPPGSGSVESSSTYGSVLFDGFNMQDQAPEVPPLASSYEGKTGFYEMLLDETKEEAISYSETACGEANCHCDFDELVHFVNRVGFNMMHDN